MENRKNDEHTDQNHEENPKITGYIGIGGLKHQTHASAYH
jgi:hypothetical protein